MHNRTTITKTRVDQLQPGSTLWDATLPGFGVRARAGAKTYFVKSRVGDRQKWITIGKHGPMTPEIARREAFRILGEIAAGNDPLAATKKKQNEKLTSFDRLAADYVRRVAMKQNRSWKETERIFNRYVIPAWKSRPVGDISRADIARLLDGIEDKNGPVMADRVLAQIRRLFNWHATRDDKFISPIVRGMARVRPRERARTRILTDDELRALWTATEDTQPMLFGPLVRLLLLTAQRRDEVANASWSEIEGTKWTIPAERYKSKRANTVPLSPAAETILKTLPKDGSYCFTTDGKSPFSGFSKAKADLDRNMILIMRETATGRGVSPDDVKLEPWVLHDLRRTARSLMSRAGVRSDVAERVLGHAINGVAGVYDRHDYGHEKAEALRKLSKLVESIIRSHETKPQLRVVA